MRIGDLVCGLTPWRDWRLRTSKVPKPVSTTRSPAWSCSEIRSRAVSTTWRACFLGTPARSATRAMNSVFCMPAMPAAPFVVWIQSDRIIANLVPLRVNQGIRITRIIVGVADSVLIGALDGAFLPGRLVTSGIALFKPDVGWTLNEPLNSALQRRTIDPEADSDLSALVMGLPFHRQGIISVTLHIKGRRRWSYNKGTSPN